MKPTLTLLAAITTTLLSVTKASEAWNYKLHGKDWVTIEEFPDCKGKN
jgi:hypothetical protein